MLPSISAAIGNFSPQREIWQGAIAIHALPRFYVAIEYLHHHYSVLFPQDLWIGQVAFFLNVVENLALIILSFFTSSKFYAVHEKAFITFIVGSEMYMVLTCILQRRYKKQSRVSYKWKKRFLVTNMVCILVAVYFFMRHNSLCEPYVYTLFALSEYIVVLSNMAFHLTAYFDFENKDLVVYKHGVALTEIIFGYIASHLIVIVFVNGLPDVPDSAGLSHIQYVSDFTLYLPHGVTNATKLPKQNNPTD
ncbi:hypothetical protein NQ317_012323 [Molorchus minor]|uniref:CWH43-like N-terminal domain-containing protein n=1 Tax=Molorchus minor TaxID=1323400 RepID=A0ABQ9IT75_9CUCU|nr:hypothetical protein NQ317_012323 [Molorchus minor]